MQGVQLSVFLAERGLDRALRVLDEQDHKPDDEPHATVTRTAIATPAAAISCSVSAASAGSAAAVGTGKHAIVFPLFGFCVIFGYDQYSAMDGGEKAPGEVPVGENVKTHKFRMASLAALPEIAGGQNPAGRF